VLFDVPVEPTFYTWLTQGGSIGILAAAVLSFAKGWIVPGTEYRRVCRERDQALEQVAKQAEIAWRALEAAERRANR
jgi:hypothetical protein